MLTTAERTRLKKLVDERRRTLNATAHGRNIKVFHANREMCAGWSVATSQPCQMFAKANSAYCRYHESA